VFVAITTTATVPSKLPESLSVSSQTCAAGCSATHGFVLCPAFITGKDGGRTMRFIRRKSLLLASIAAVVLATSAAPAADVKRGEHPLDRAIAMATSSLENIDQNIKGYRCRFVKLERTDGGLGEYSSMEMRVRHKPFSVYLKFIEPDAGQQALFVKGKNDDCLLAKPAGLLGFKTHKLHPLSPLAMQGKKYPITEAGVRNLILRLLDVARHDRRSSETEANYYQNAKVDGRACNVIEVVHPVQRDTFLFYKAQVFVDKELNVPIRYAAYMWPPKPGDEAPLDEEYTYLDFKIEDTLTDADFVIE